MGLDYRHVRLNEATGIFEEVPTLGSRVASVFRCLGVPARGLWTLVKLPFVLTWWIVCLPFRGIAAIGRGIGRVRWKRILSRRLGNCARPLGMLFAPVVWWWGQEREAYREGDWFMVVICLLPGYFIYLAYKYLLLFLVGLCCGRMA